MRRGDDYFLAANLVMVMRDDGELASLRELLLATNSRRRVARARVDSFGVLPRLQLFARAAVRQPFSL